MSMCLAEAMLQGDRAAMLEAKSITLLRDARKGTVAVRFVLVNNRLKVRAGLLGVVGHLSRFGNGPLGLLQTTKHLMHQFATTLPPTSATQLHAPVLKAIRRRCHMVTVDAAADEVTASELTRQPISEVFGALTPNLRIILRDKAHASRRPHFFKISKIAKAVFVFRLFSTVAAFRRFCEEILSLRSLELFVCGLVKCGRARQW